MVCMLCDHIWATLSPVGMDWLTWVGRIAFPIFAFLLAEGYCHTHDVKKYLLRLLIVALISEIPFNFMTGGGWFYPFHQNVLFTFILGLLAVWAVDSVRKKHGDGWQALLTLLGVGLGSVIAGTITFVDYFAAGPLTVLIFYLFRGSRWWQRLLQFLGMYWLNCVAMGGLTVPLTLFGHSFDFPQQGFAMLALIPIWLYRGQHGPYNKTIRAVFYFFYPVHIAVLVLLAFLIK